MLDKLRDPWWRRITKSVVTYVIFGLICLTFVFVGVTPDQGGPASAGTAATVNNVVIPFVDFQERVKMMEDQMKNVSAAERQLRSRQVREYAMEELVRNELLFQSAEQVGILPTVSALRDFIVSVPIFQEDGRFMRDRYNQYLAYRNTTAPAFEGLIKRDIVIRQLRDLFMTSLAAPAVIQGLDQEIKGMKADFEFVKIDPTSLVQNGLDAEIKAFISNPENEKKLTAYYDSHKEEYTAPLELRARHILLKGEGEAVLAKIKDIRKEAEKGDFAELAKKYSEDEGTKAKGGDLNFFTRGQMVGEFEDAAFSLPIGKLSEPVKSSFGYHLIKVEERRGGDPKKFEHVKNDIAKKLMSEELKAKSLAELTSLLKEKKDVSAWLSRFKLKWEGTGEFNLSQSYIPKLNINADTIEAVLTSSQPGEIHPQIVQSGGASYIFRLKKITRSEPAKKDDDIFGQSPLQLAGGSETLWLWSEEMKKAARIRRNEAILN